MIYRWWCEECQKIHVYDYDKAFDWGWVDYEVDRDGQPLPALALVTLRRWELERIAARQITATALRRWPSLEDFNAR